MELLEKKYSHDIQVSTKEQELDEVGVPIFDDMVEIKMAGSTLLATWKLLRDMIMEHAIVPVLEHPPFLKLMDLVVENEESATEKGIITLPINYAVGLCKALEVADSARIGNLPSTPMGSKNIKALIKELRIVVYGYTRLKNKEEEDKIEGIPSPSSLLDLHNKKDT